MDHTYTPYRKFSRSNDLKKFLKSFHYEKLSQATPTHERLDFTVIDTETTGLDAATCEIIDVAAIRFRNGEAVETFSTLLRPHSWIPLKISAINHITNAMVAGKPYFSEIIPELSDFIGTDNIVGQNLSFDLGFVFNYGLELTCSTRYYDTMLIGRDTLVSHYTGYYDRATKKYIKRENDPWDVENHKLGTLCEYYGVELIDAHRAENDARATGKLFVKMGKHV